VKMLSQAQHSNYRTD